MQRKVIYIADDGTRFDDKEDCLKYEAILNKCKNIMSSLYYDEKALNNGKAIIHDQFFVKSCFERFMDLCSEVIPQYKKEFQEVKEGTRHTSHAEYCISEYSNDFPCLQRAMYRFTCIDKYGIEYNQPYFVKHRLDFKGGYIPARDL